MKIQGYSVGTSVQWMDGDSGGFQTGVVRARYYDPDTTEINGETIDINVIGNSPTYKVEAKTNNRMIVLRHTKVTSRSKTENN